MYFGKEGNILGQIIQVHCAQCGFEKNIFVGGGLLDCELKTIFTALPEDGQDMLIAAANYGVNQFSITRKLSVCDSCGTVYALPVVTYTLNGIHQEIYGACPQCGMAGNEWQQKEIFPCPDCGSQMTLIEAGHWD